ncbi:MAG TPA: caspase family protein [Bacteroidales bacterium]|nr:caspase family protein [Bacteroidales bacterium]HOH22912.1 caspase family protein [Bacteroidales bacterium]HPZ04183.1 caspase family protein [Bacteroidales bacterium]HQB75620.1 caspase family protein [Bacteroidales bacterium]
MIRRALIIYCNNTKSGKLPGPDSDNNNLIKHLTSNLGGNWYNSEILSLPNPTIKQVESAVITHLKDTDYSFVVFSGHGGINIIDNKQYIELKDGDIAVNKLFSNAKRQTIIIDACRSHYTPGIKLFSDSLIKSFESVAGTLSTRSLFDKHILNCEEGLTILYAASENQSASDSDNGAAYLSSLLKVCMIWEKEDTENTKLSLKTAHKKGSIYMKNHFDTIQNPIIKPEKRKKYYPLAVKYIP